MSAVTSIETLEALYDAVPPRALQKVVSHLTPRYQEWINASRFLILSTVGPEGTDASPRGDDGPVVHIADNKTLHLPDWRGNNRLDSLKNIVRDGRVSLMFMIPGCNNVVRVNGHAFISTDSTLTEKFDKNGKHPRTVITITVQEAYFQCAKALMRSRLWASDDESQAVPTAGDFVRELDETFDGQAYDKGYADYAKPRMW